MAEGARDLRRTVFGGFLVIVFLIFFLLCFFGLVRSRPAAIRGHKPEHRRASGTRCNDQYSHLDNEPAVFHFHYHDYLLLKRVPAARGEAGHHRAQSPSRFRRGVS